jgi:hypothetical protein
LSGERLKRRGRDQTTGDGAVQKNLAAIETASGFRGPRHSHPPLKIT